MLHGDPILCHNWTKEIYIITSWVATSKNILFLLSPVKSNWIFH